MYELITTIVLAAVNVSFIVYLVKFMPQRMLSQENVDFVIDSVISRVEDFAENSGLSDIDIPSLIENLKTGVVSDLIEGVSGKVKMALLGQKGGFVSGESRNRGRLLEAVGEDLMNQQPAWLRTILKMFPSVTELIEQEPGLIAEIPALLEEVKKRFNIDLTQYIGSDNGTDRFGNPVQTSRFWW